MARKPKRFKLTAETPKYEGTEEPEAWLDDYLTAVKFQKGTETTTMQYIQLQMVGAMSSWLKSLDQRSGVQLVSLTRRCRKIIGGTGLASRVEFFF